MQFRVGYELIYDFPQPTPIILVVNVHESRASDLVVSDRPTSEPPLPITSYRDAFGNQCHRVLAPPGRLRLTADSIVNDSGQPDTHVRDAGQDTVQDLPEDTLVFLLGSRYCETDLLSETAWQLFSDTTPGYSRVQAICDFVHHHIYFNYQNARANRTATGAFNERTGVCRDYAHLAIAFCRCMNIPAQVLHWIPERCGNAAPLRRGRFRRVVRGLDRRPLADVRPSQQRAAHRSHSDGAWARRVRRGHRHDVRPQYPRALQRLDRRDSRQRELPEWHADVVSHGEPLDRLPVPRARPSRRAPHDVPSAGESRPAA